MTQPFEPAHERMLRRAWVVAQLYQINRFSHAQKLAVDKDSDQNLDPPG